jgi:hypothetical protein
MNTKTENIVLMNADEYVDMLAKAERTDEYLDRLAKQEAIKIAKENIGKIRVRIGLTGRDYDEKEVDIRCYDELNPQLEHLVQKIKYWAQEALQEEHGTWHYLSKAKKQIEALEEDQNKYGRIAAWSFLSAFALAVLLIAVLIFK